MIEVKQVSALEKVFLHRGMPKEEQTCISALQGERISWQIVYYKDDHLKMPLEITADCPFELTVRKVGHVPVTLAAFDDATDENYLSTEPGLYPDVLLEPEHIEAIPFQYHTLWITVQIPRQAPAGDYEAAVTLKNKQQDFMHTEKMRIKVIGEKLPEQTIKFTNWFHADCIAAYYKTKMFSEKHWQLLEQFIGAAVHCGVNMLLTPLFTPPLDTAIGGERPTVQLVEVTKEGNTYRFGFEKLKRWIDICRRQGILYYEMAHLFTQWGAEHAPKIVVNTAHGRKKKFGWKVRADAPEYIAFLDAFLPQLTAFLKKEGIAAHTYFHVSDEPSLNHLESYAKAKAIVKKHLEGFKVIDALSSLAFYKNGLVEIPVPETGHAEAFFEEADLPERWCYYCCGQGVKLSNRFMAMPSARNRIIGTQFYKYQVEGFLHWGFNFYFSRQSEWAVDPFSVTDAAGGFPSGDSFAVYPGKQGAIESIRSEVFYQALQDLSAMQLLERLAGREAVLSVIERSGKITFTEYPKDAAFLLETREKINQDIAAHLG